MALFRFHCSDPQKTTDIVYLYYNNKTSSLTYDNGLPVAKVRKKIHKPFSHYTSKNDPASKVRAVKTLKIQLGLTCNYGCTYCSQRFVPRAAVTSLADADAFLDGLPDWIDAPADGDGFRIEFWGGEPFVYYAAMKKLAESLRKTYPKAEFLVITNGSLLNKEINQWLDETGFVVGISHDGPGQHVRGPDPLKDPIQLEIIRDLFNRLYPKGRISFNSMIHKGNQSRAAVAAYFKEFFGHDAFMIGEGGFIDAYDEGGAQNSLPAEESVLYRRNTYKEFISGRAKNFQILSSRVEEFINSLETLRPADVLGQKCGMDDPETVAVDLKGNVVTCQNVSHVSKALNGESHKVGHISDLAGVALKTSTHWKHRPECGECPVLQLCKGNCMMLEGDLWEVSCNNAYSDLIPALAGVIHYMTGYHVFKIEPLTGSLRPERQWLWRNPPQD